MVHGLLMELIRATGVMEQDQMVPGHTVSLSQAFALHELDTEPPLSQQDLAARLRLEKSTVSRMAVDLERKGLLARERDPGNRRNLRLRLTDAGRAAHVQMAATFHERYGRWVAGMTPDERDALVTGLGGLVRAIRRDPSA